MTKGDQLWGDGPSPIVTFASALMRTARSRTSGEKWFDYFMAQSSRRVEPPQNPGPFAPWNVDSTTWRNERSSLHEL